MCRQYELSCSFRMEIVCYIIGAASFIFSTFLTNATIVYLVLENHRQQFETANSTAPHFLQLFFEQYLNKKAVDVVMVLTLFIGLSWMLFSILLIRGIKKNNPTLIMCYFLFGIVIVILGLLSALLELLQMYWKISLSTFLVTLVYIHCLIVVHSAYDLLQRGKCLGSNEHRLLEEEIDEAFDPVILERGVINL